jgi:hypothetical protein
MQPNLTKNKIIEETLDSKVKNLEPTLRVKLFEKLLLRDDITSITKCTSIVYSNMLKLAKAGMGSKKYWVTRGWDDLNSEIKAKIHMKVINAKADRDSPYSLNFWMKRINPVTGSAYTELEAEFERNSRRPIRKEYWMAKGYSLDESVRLADEQKTSNNKKGANGSRSRDMTRMRAHSHRTVDYWILRGFSAEEASQKVSDSQVMFSKEICVQKYGEQQGLQIWSERQINWLTSLKLSGLHGGYSKISLELFNNLGSILSNLHYGENETIIKTENMSYSIDCVDLNSKKIIEFYGDYWHANPNRFIESDQIKKKTAKHIWEHDASKINALKNAGYKVLIIWESDYNKDKQGTINKCIHFLTA